MARTGRRERVNHVESIYGTLKPRAGEDAASDAFFIAPYRRAVGTYAEAHASELKEPEPPLPVAEAHAEAAPDPRDSLEPAAAATATSVAELREAIRKHQAHAWDPEERFGAPQTTSMQVGWGARQQPAESVRFPKVVSDTTRTAELLFKSAKAGQDF